MTKTKVLDSIKNKNTIEQHSQKNTDIYKSYICSKINQKNRKQKANQTKSLYLDYLKRTSKTLHEINNKENREIINNAGMSLRLK